MEDVELTRHTQELLLLVELEGAVNLNKGPFEDEHGDIHDWQADLITHHYLCRQLYLHYNQHVRGGGLGGRGFTVCCFSR